MPPIEQIDEDMIKSFLCQMKIRYSENFNLMIHKDNFESIYQRQLTIKNKECAGVIIFNEQFTRILLVKGRSSRKWSYPKGHREYLENNLETAIRETDEEIGYQIKLKVPLLPSIIINKIKLYCLMISENTHFKINDYREISEIRWHNLNNIQESIAKRSYAYNSAVRRLFEKPVIVGVIKQKICSYINNYLIEPGSNLEFNTEIEQIIESLKSFEINFNEKIHFHYFCFTVIQSIYNNSFATIDLVNFIKQHI